MGARRFAVGFLVGVMVLLSGIGVMLSLRGLERGEAFTMNIQASPPRLRFEYHGRPPDKKTRQTVIFKKTKGRTNDSSIEVRCESGETRRSGEKHGPQTRENSSFISGGGLRDAPLFLEAR